MQDPEDPTSDEPGFPSLQWEDDDLPTRPLPLAEMPLQVRIDHEMATVAEFHPRIADAIQTFWGHRDCVEYIEKLVLSGGYTSDREKARIGFKTEVLSALINLAQLHRSI